MKTFQKAPLALAITALLAAPYALANGLDGDIDLDGDVYVGVNLGLDKQFNTEVNNKFNTTVNNRSDTTVDNSFTTTVENEFSSDIEKNFTSDTEKNFTSNVDVEVDVDKTYTDNVNTSYEDIYSLNQDYDISVDMEFEGYSTASVASKQLNAGNTTNNVKVDNDATVDGSALRSASGNIGVNVAAGDNNQQANDAALAASDAEQVFAMASAQSLQVGTGNSTANRGVSNNADLSGNALRSAAGNIGVNIASGSSNLQQNSLAASVSSSTGAEASAGGAQLAYANTTDNRPHSYTREGSQAIEATFEIDASGLILDQEGNVYPDTWGADSNDGQHESEPGTGHIDLDDSVQMTDKDGNEIDVPDYNDDGGALAFRGTEDSVLSGTISGAMPAEITVVTFHDNTASLGGNALRGASGNIGVNIASGSNNMQRNSLALSASMGNGGTQ